MKLTKADREYIKRNFWESERNIDQIEEAIPHTKYRYCGAYIGVKRVIELIGREGFLSGMDRSAFHWTATYIDDTGEPVLFDSSEYFRVKG